MTEKDVMNLLNPSALVIFESDLQAADGTVIIGEGQTAGLKLRHVDAWGAEISIWDHPTAAEPSGHATPGEIAERVRLTTADEERAWIRKGEETE